MTAYAEHSPPAALGNDEEREEMLTQLRLHLIIFSYELICF